MFTISYILLNFFSEIFFVLHKMVLRGQTPGLMKNFYLENVLNSLLNKIDIYRRGKSASSIPQGIKIQSMRISSTLP